MSHKISLLKLAPFGKGPIFLQAEAPSRLWGHLTFHGVGSVWSALDYQSLRMPYADRISSALSAQTGAGSRLVPGRKACARGASNCFPLKMRRPPRHEVSARSWTFGGTRGSFGVVPTISGSDRLLPRKDRLDRPRACREHQQRWRNSTERMGAKGMAAMICTGLHTLASAQTA
jgi:hypothetical protein